MAYVITDECTKDDVCATACPEECISVGTVEVDGQSYDQYFIDPSRCTDCGLCEQSCPNAAIYAEFDLPTALKRFAKANTVFFD